MTVVSETEGNKILNNVTLGDNVKIYVFTNLYVCTIHDGKELQNIIAYFYM